VAFVRAADFVCDCVVAERADEIPEACEQRPTRPQRGWRLHISLQPPAKMNSSKTYHSAILMIATGAASLALSLTSLAQSTGSSTPDQAPPASQEQVVQMSSFVVTTTAGMGYVDANSVSGFQMSDISAYAGVAHFIGEMIP
jgi:hypothetical protein